MKYKDELIRSMEWLSEKDNTIFLGQSVSYSGNAIFNTLKTLPEDKRIELPVFEEIQMGMSTGMALEGYVPISCYPRFDFLLRSMDALVNHLDKFPIISNFKTRAIIRTGIGSVRPLHPHHQHTGDFTEAFNSMCSHIEVIRLDEPEDIFPAYTRALTRKDGKSTILVEWGDYYSEK